MGAGDNKNTTPMCPAVTYPKYALVPNRYWTQTTTIGVIYDSRIYISAGSRKERVG